MRSVYYSLTYSHLQYAIGVWGGAGKTALKRLNVLHNKVLRAMTYSSYATRVATRGGYIWQMASTVKAKRSLKHLGPKIWDSIDPSLYDISLPVFKRQLKDKLVNEYSG